MTALVSAIVINRYLVFPLVYEFVGRLRVRRIRWFLIPIIAGLFSLPNLAQNKYSPSEAKEHYGETATVCGAVVSTRYADSTKGQPTFLNLDKPYPNQVFTIVIWGNNRDKFGTPENIYKGKRICVTGKITAYAGLPEIVADEPKQIRSDSEK